MPEARQWLTSLRLLVGGTPTTVAAAALLFTALLLAVLRVTTLESIGGLQLSARDWVMSDFKTTAYYPAQDFAAGYNPYDSAGYLARHPAPEAFGLYPPATLLVNRPIASLPLETAMEVEFAITFLLSGLLGLASLRLAGAAFTTPRLLTVWGLILLSRPGQWNLLQGQMTLPVALAAYAAIALPRRFATAAGAALAVTLLKPTFGVPLALLMLAAGYYRALATAAGLTTLANLPPLAILARRAGGLAPFLHTYFSPGGRLHQVAIVRSQFSVFRIDAVALLTRWVGPLGRLAPVLIATVVLGLTAFALRPRRWALARPELDPTSVGLICSAVLLAVFHIGYDLLLLTWPCVALVWSLRPGSGEVPRHAWPALGLYALLAGNYFTSFAVLDALQARETLALVLSSLNGVALAALFCLYLHGALSRSEPKPA